MHQMVAKIELKAIEGHSEIKDSDLDNFLLTRQRLTVNKNTVNVRWGVCCEAQSMPRVNISVHKQYLENGKIMNIG